MLRGGSRSPSLRVAALRAPYLVMPDGTPSGDISPVVHVVAASRPPMLWVDGGAIYALVDAEMSKNSHRVLITL